MPATSIFMGTSAYILKPDKIINGVSSGNLVKIGPFPATEPLPIRGETFVTPTDGLAMSVAIYMLVDNESEIPTNGDVIEYEESGKRWEVAQVNVYKALLGDGYMAEIGVIEDKT